MEIFKSFLKRLLIVAIPLLGLYYFSELAFESNRQKEHPTDVGLGIAIFLFFILFLLFLGFFIDTIIRIVKKDHKTILINVIFLLPFLILILYFGTLFSGGPLYELVKDFSEQEFIYLVLIYLVLISIGFLIIYKYSLKIILIYLTVLSCITGRAFAFKLVILILCKRHYQKLSVVFDFSISDTFSLGLAS